MKQMVFGKVDSGKKFAFVLFALLFMGVRTTAQISVSGYTPPAKKTEPTKTQMSVAEKIAQGQLPLSRKYPNIRLDATRVHTLNALPSSAQEQKRKEKKLHIGAIRKLPQALSNNDATLHKIAEGQLAILRITAVKAQAIKLHFTDLDLPKGAKLFVYSAQNADEIWGPYIERGPNSDKDFWTPPVRGESVVVELFLPATEKAENAENYFRITELSHIFRDVRTELAAEAAANCNQDITPEWSEAAKSTGLLQFRTADGEYACTGTLLNTADNSGTPYVLTAHHCVGNFQTARSVDVFWLYDKPTATGQPDYTKGTFGGATLLATNEVGDFSLLKLNNNSLPAGVRFSGWSSVAPTPSTSVTGIHHPQADYKRISFGQTISESCLPEIPAALCDSFLKVRWNQGITEPGSSGSGLYTGSASDPKLVGILTGGKSSCATRSGTDYYGRFDLAFPALSYYLANTGCAYALSQTNQMLSANLGSGSIGVSVREGEGCGWSASSDVAWITITSGTTGNGEGMVSYTVAANTGSRRTGMLTIAGQRVVITQQGFSETCGTSSISDNQTITGTLSAADCRSIVNVTTYADRITFTGVAGKQAALQLTSTTFDTYLTLLDPQGHIVAQDDDERDDTNSRLPAQNGFFTLLENGTYTIEVSSAGANEVGNYSLTLTSGCAADVSPRNVTFSALGNFVYDDFLNFTKKDPACYITPVQISDVNWVRPFSNSDDRVYFQVDENTGRYPRTGTLYVTGIPVTVQQRAYCNPTNAPTLSAITKTINPFGGEVAVNVQMAAGANCSWKVERSASWVSAQSGGGNGNGIVKFTVAKNVTINTRTVTLKVAGQDFTITQPGINNLCSVTPLTLGQTANGTLSTNDCNSVLAQETYADYYSFSGVAGQQIALEMKANDFSVTFVVFDPAGNTSVCCAGAISDNQFRLPYQGYADLPLDGTYIVMVTSREPQKIGNYALSFTGVGGPGCSYKISPTTNIMLADASSASFTLTAGSTCQWNVTSNVDWITFPDSKTGSGTKEIKFNIAPNTGAKRSGFIEVAGRIYSILQDAPCTYVELSASKATLRPVGGQSASTSVTTGRTCAWSYAGLPDWINYVNYSPAPTIGEGYVSFYATENRGAFRSATVTVAGRPFLIEQRGGVQALVSAADYRPEIAPGGLGALFGSGMIEKTEIIQSLPAPTELAGIRVNIWDGFKLHRCELLYASPYQINFKIPDDAAAVPAQLWLEDSSGSFYSNQLPIVLSKIAPSLFTISSDGTGTASALIQRVKGNSQTYEQVFEPDGKGGLVAKAIDLSKDDEQVYLLLYGTGIRNRTEAKNVSVLIGNVTIPVDYAGAQGFYLGLDQINVLLPKSLRGKGTVSVTVTVDGKKSNPVEIKIAP